MKRIANGLTVPTKPLSAIGETPQARRHWTRRTARHFALDGLSLWDSVLRKERALSARRVVQVMMFHHVYPQEEAAFSKFLQWYKKHYHVISYTEAVDRVQSGDIDRAYGAITFDDGLKSTVKAARIMKEQEVPGCFFVCPGIVGQTDPVALRRFCESRQMLYESDEFVSWEDLEQMKSLGHEIGSHTVTHPNLAAVSVDVATEELQRSREILSTRFGKVDHFAWPYGTFDFLGIAAAKLVLEAGYTSCASGHRGTHAAHTGPPLEFPCLRRDNLEANWPLRHIRHFLLRNAEHPISPSDWWPAEWQMPVRNK